MKRFIILILFTLSVSMYVHAQNYHEIGLRAGGTSGFTFRTVNPNGSALEGIVGLWDHGVSFTALYEIHFQAFDVNGLNWFYGGGVHVVFYGADYERNTEPSWHSNYPPYVDYGTFGLGLDGTIGIEYKIPEIPITVSFEFKPFIEFISSNNMWFSMDPGLGIRFVF